MARHTVLHLLTSVLATTAVFAAPAPIRTQAPEVKRGLEKRVDNVIVNIGAVTTVKTVVKTAVPVFVPVIVDGQTRTATSVVKVVEEITTTMTQTAVATKLVATTVLSGKTIPVTVTTTAFDLQLATITAVLQSTSTLYQQSVIIETKQGEPLRKTVTVAATPTDEGRPQPTKASDQQPIPSVWHKKPDDTGSPGAPTARQGQPSAANTADTGASAPETLSSAAPGDTSAPDNSLNLNNTANANSGSNATLDSSNTNTNNVTVSLGGSGGIGDWVSNNKTIVIVIGVGVAVALVIAIIAAVLECGGSKRSGGGGPATGQTVVVSNPDRAVAPEPVANSLARPSRRRYARVGNDDSSEISESSADEKRSSYGRNSRRGSVASNASGRSQASIGGYAEASLARSSRRASSRSRSSV